MKHNIDIGLIITDYNLGMSSTQIGNKYNISGTHIVRLLRSSDIPIRSPSERLKLSQNRPEVKEKLSLAATARRLSEESKDKLRKRIGSKNHNWNNGLCITKSGYLQFTASKANGEHAGRLLHILICEHKYGRKLQDGEHVHHIDKNKLNNNPNNLVILTASEHAKLHSEDRINGKKIRRSSNSR